MDGLLEENCVRESGTSMPKHDNTTHNGNYGCTVRDT